MRVSPVSSRRALLAALTFCAFALCLAFAGPSSSAQSGRRQPKPVSPVPEATPTPEPEGESESQPRPRRGDTGGVKPLASFIVYEQDDMLFDTSVLPPGLMLDTFVRRLGKSPSVQVDKAAKKATRGEAVKRARSEPEAHVVLLQLQTAESEMGRDSMGRVDPNRLVIRLFVFAPQSGTLKYEDTIMQRAYRQTTTVGPVRVPLPTTGRADRYPVEVRLEQAARDAADRVMMRFDIPLPPDN